MSSPKVQPARPEPISLDSVAALVGAVLAGSGISSILGFAWGLSIEMSLAFIAIGLPMLFVQRRLGYRLEEGLLHADVLTGTRTLDLAQVTDARVVDGWLVGPGLPAYHTGLTYLTGQGVVQAYASRIRGPFLLLQRGGARPWLVSPHEPEAFLEIVRRR